MEQVPRFVVVRVARRGDLDQHHVVELEAFDLAHVGDVDAGAERKVLLRDQAHVRHLGVAQASA